MIDRVKGPAATEVLQGASRANFTHASEGRWEPCRNLDHLIFRLGSARLSLPSFKPWRTRYEPVNYGISNYWSTCQNVQTKLYKIPKFGINRPKHKQDTAVWKCQNLQRNVRPSGRFLMPYISLLILNFLNRCISVKTSLINTKLGNLVNLGVLFLTIWINSC